MSDLPIKLTMKSGSGYDAPWITVDAADPSDLEFKLDALLDNEGAAFAKAVQAATLLAGAWTVASGTAAPSAPAAAAAPQAAPAQQAGGWSNSPQQAAPAWSGASRGGPVNGSPHPENKACTQCGQVIAYKSVKDGKFKMWACPSQRAKGDGHTVEWID